jgi:hypothetical protein
MEARYRLERQVTPDTAQRNRVPTGWWSGVDVPWALCSEELSRWFSIPKATQEIVVVVSTKRNKNAYAMKPLSSRHLQIHAGTKWHAVFTDPEVVEVVGKLCLRGNCSSVWGSIEYTK